jgi:DNA-binding CsgD family transcriptional regulator
VKRRLARGEALTSPRQPVPGTLPGRVRELTELERALDRLQSGKPWMVQVVGEPGIGKSRLLSELARRAEARGYLVLEGRAAEFERQVPFGVVVDALNDYTGALQRSQLRALGDETLAELAALFPSLAGLAPEPTAPRLQAERFRAHYAIRSLLERLASQQPVVLALDDLHWADDASIEVIGHLVRRFRGPFLGAFAFRQPTVRLAAELDAAERAGFGSRLVLAPLTAEEADALFDPRLDASTRAAVYSESGGNPFYLEALQHAASPPEAVLADRPAPEASVAPPASVAAAIRDEVGGLPDDARRVLESAAVAGETFEPELVIAISGAPEPVTLAALDRLLDADLVRPTDVPRRFRFRHPIVRRAVYDGMPPGWRLGAHARAASALEAAGAQLAARAHHVERSAAAGDEHAIAVLTDAARASAPRAPLAAGRWLSAALRLLPDNAGPQRRLALLTEAATVLGQAGVFDESLAALERALPLVPAERAEERAALIVQIATAKRQTGHPLESRALVEDALVSLRDHDGVDALTLRVELALGRYFAGDFREMRELAAALGRIAGERADSLLAALAAALVSVADVSLGRIPDGMTALREARVAFDSLSDERLAARVDLCGWIGLAAVRLERIDDALRCARRGLALSRATGQGSMVPGLLGLEAQALLLRGQVTEAVRVAETATDAARLSGTDQLLVWALQTMSTAAMWAGDTERAIASAREAVALADRFGESFLAPLAHLHLAGALQAAGDAPGASAELAALESESAGPLLDLGAGRGWELLARTNLELGDLDAAADATARAETRAAATGLPQLTATAQCARAAVALARGDVARAAEAAGAATAGAERAGNTLLAARAQALAGAAMAEQGARQRGVAELERARETLLACGARREADAAARQLRRLGRRVARPARASQGTGLGSLSAREREVADQVAAGKTNRSIAAALFLSEKTIESHLARIYDKLDVRSRVELAALIARERDQELPVR